MMGKGLKGPAAPIQQRESVDDEEVEIDMERPLTPGRPATLKKTQVSGERIPNLTKIVLLSSAGNVLEWMDFSVYAFLAKQIGAAFFPPAKGEAQLIESFSVFAGAFVVRPLGGIIFGYIGDKYSKKFSLQLSLFVMALSTTCIGLLPTYHTIGHAAPILLTLLRMIQGIAVGGQLVGVMVFVDSHAPPHQRGFYGGLSLAGAAFGVLLGAVVGTIVYEAFSKEQLQAYGFRIPFLMGFLVAAAGLALHKQVPDVQVAEKAVSAHSPEHSPSFGRTPSMNESSSKGAPFKPPAPANPLLDLMRYHKLEILNAIAVTILYCTAFYECFVWMGTYLSTLAPGAPIPQGFLINTLWLAVYTLLVPFAGSLADRVGYYKVMMAGAIWIFFCAPLVFLIMQKGTTVAAFFGQSLFVIGVALHAGPMTVYLCEHATTSRHTYSAVAWIYNFAQASFGGVAVIVCTAIAKKAGGLGPGLWLSGVAAISIVAMWLGKDRGRTRDLTNQGHHQTKQGRQNRGVASYASGATDDYVIQPEERSLSYIEIDNNAAIGP